MRRIVGLFSALATAAALTVVGGASASAAAGTLYVSGIPYANPSGCHNGAALRNHVHNATEGTVRVHLLRDCHGPVMAKIEPGQTRVGLGKSVHVGQLPQMGRLRVGAPPAVARGAPMFSVTGGRAAPR